MKEDHCAQESTLDTSDTVTTGASSFDERGGEPGPGSGGTAGDSDIDSDSEWREASGKFKSFLRSLDPNDAGWGDGEEDRDEGSAPGPEPDEVAEAWNAIVDRGSNFLETWEAIPSMKAPRTLGVAKERCLARKEEEQEARADLDRSGYWSFGGGSAEGGRGKSGYLSIYHFNTPDSHEVCKDKEQGEEVARPHSDPGQPQDTEMSILSNPSDGWISEHNQGRRGRNGFAYFGLPPHSHDAWRNQDQEKMVMRRHPEITRTWSGEDFLQRRIQLAEEKTLEAEERQREAERKEREAEMALARDRKWASVRRKEACEQAKIEAVREERSRVHEEKQREWNELNRDYPVPDYLKDYVTGVNNDLDKYFMADRFVNIGITGQSGTGKSSLVRKMLSYFGTDPEETPHVSFEADGTTEPTPYVVPGLNERVRLWDLPGQGTEQFPSVSYLRDMGLKYFDALLVTTDGRWKTDDSVLVDAIHSAGIWFRVVRTKADLAVESGEHDYGLSQEEALEQVRATLQEQLINVDDPDIIYLVTTRSQFWGGHQNAPFGLVSTICDELMGFLETRAPGEC